MGVGLTLQDNIVNTVRNLAKGRLCRADETFLITLIATKNVNQIQRFAQKLAKGNNAPNQLFAGDWANLRTYLNQLSGKVK